MGLVINFGVAILSGAVGCLLVIFFSRFPKDMTVEQFDKILNWVRVAATAAENIYGRYAGEDKRDFAKAVLSSIGIDIEEESAGAMLDSVVYDINNEREDREAWRPQNNSETGAESESAEVP